MNLSRLGRSLICGALLSMGLGTAGYAANDPQHYMQVSGSASAPIGHVDFCKRLKGECRAATRKPTVIRLTRDRWDELLDVNARINRAVEPITDQDLYSRPELWAYPNGAGDCEDYVLLKRRTLIKAGWPASALLITVVRDTDGGGHAVLTARTDRGDLILDNQIEAVLPWYRTPYRYIKRQSETNSARWRRISDQRVGAVASINK